MQRPPLVVVIDGPAGAGKSTAARQLAAVLGLPLLDTGALYRSVAWAAAQRGISWDDEDALAALARGLDVHFEATAAGAPQRVWCDGVDVTVPIRTPEMSDGAARVSRHPRLRAALLGLQRAAAASGCVAEGRDLGTVVFPDADVKVFLTASAEARARRRLLDPAASAGGTSALATPAANDVEDEGALAQVAAELRMRDERDSSRAVAPLRQAVDAVLLDSSDLAEDDVLARLLDLVEAARTRGT